MATKSGMIQSYINTAPDKRMVTDRILMIEPYNIATYLALGTDVGKFSMTNGEGKVYEWLEDTFTPVTTTLNTAAMQTNTTTARAASSKRMADHYGPNLPATMKKPVPVQPSIS